MTHSRLTPSTSSTAALLKTTASTANNISPWQIEEFTPLPRLLAELDLRIWKFSMPGPRNITLRTAHWQQNIRGEILSYKSITMPPAGLFVYSESRAEFLKTYQLLPTTACCPSSDSNTASIYFAHDRDTLELALETFGYYFQYPHLTNVRLNSEWVSQPLALHPSAGPSDSFNSIEPVSVISHLRFNIQGIRKFHFGMYELFLAILILFKDIEVVTLYMEDCDLDPDDRLWHWDTILKKANLRTRVNGWKGVAYIQGGEITGSDHQVCLPDGF